MTRGALLLSAGLAAIAWSLYAAGSHPSGGDPWTLGPLARRLESQPAMTGPVQDRHGKVLAQPIYERGPKGRRWVIERPFGRPLAAAGLGRDLLQPQGLQGSLAGVMRTGADTRRPFEGDTPWLRLLLGDPVLTAPTMPMTHTTLDADLSTRIYELLGRRGLKGSAVVLHAPTGELHAIVDYPAPDVNSSALPTARDSLDALHGTNLPASTMKLLSAAYILERRPKTASNTHVCTGDRCWTRHGLVRGLDEAVVQSCNTWFRLESRAWKRGDWLEFLAQTGLQPPDTPGLPLTPIVLTGPAGPRMHWPHAVGQEIYVSLVGLALAVANITFGAHVDPVVVRGGARDREGESVVRPDTAKRLREMLAATARTGTARSVNRTYRKGDAGAKTGTGERDGQTSDAVMAAIVPWQTPEWVVVATLKGGGRGASLGELVGRILGLLTRAEGTAR